MIPSPRDLINRKPTPGVCVDCNGPAVLLDRLDPLCMRCAHVIGAAILSETDTLNMQTCVACKYAYNANEHDRCPNSECAMNEAPCCALCGNTDWLVDASALCEACYESENRDLGEGHDEEDGMHPPLL